MYAVTLAAPDDFDAWREAARALIRARVAPEDIAWQADGPDLFGEPDLPAPVGAMFSVPKAFMDLAKAVVCHRDPERFAWLYQLLYRLGSEPALIHDHADPLVRRLEERAKAVRRDIHKMRAFVRFRELAVPAAENDAHADARFVAWFEPEHRIVRVNAPFFVRRFANMPWSILTPELCVHWDGTILTESTGAQKSDAPDGDPVEDMWKSYYAAIFNPARVKIGAMLSEMPKKYWKNMPETALIPAMIASAQARESGMIARLPTTQNGEVAYETLRTEARACQRCPLYRPATQTVFGEGPVDAPLMFVGEQPGDREDIAGKPFVGPAGEVFNRALRDAGIDRTRTYVTNAVKHFKFEQRGPRRIHAKPGAGEIDACRWWLEQELAMVRPAVTVALGATAVRSLFGKTQSVGPLRGRVHHIAGIGDIWVTVHPSYLLRIDDKAAAAAFTDFVADLARIRDHVESCSASPAA